MLGESPQLLSPQAELAIPRPARDRTLARRQLAGRRRGFGAFHAKGQLEWVDRTVAFQNACVQMDDNEADGTLSVNFTGARPAIEGTLGLKALDLSTVPAAAPTPMPEQRQPADHGDRGASGLEFPAHPGRSTPTCASPPTASSLPALTIGRSAATVSLRGGKMLADIAELEIDDGTRGGGQIRIDMSGANPSYGVQAKFEAARRRPRRCRRCSGIRPCRAAASSRSTSRPPATPARACCARSAASCA